MKFIITVDTEVDNQWKKADNLSYKNIYYLERFQKLCEAHNFKPTYLVTYDVAADDNAAQELNRIISNNRAEIGAHLHSWSTPPYPKNKSQYIFSSEISDDELKQQLNNLTKKVESVFGQRPVSFRGGRWSLDKRMPELLNKLEYKVDCSVSPRVNWKKIITKGNRELAPDYSLSDGAPYDLVKNNLVEVPMTVIYTRFLLIFELFFKKIILFLPAKIINKIFDLKWLRIFPETNLSDLKKIYNAAVYKKMPVMEFMIHSSELMPGGSPYSKNKGQVEHIYELLEKFFKFLNSQGVEGVTLKDYFAYYQKNKL